MGAYVHCSLASWVRTDHNETPLIPEMKPMKRHLGWAALGLTIWFLTPSGARAQTPEYHGPSEKERSQSHVPIEVQGTDFNQALLQRFRMNELMRKAKETWDLSQSKGRDNSEVQKRLEAIEQDPLYQELKQLHNREGDGSVPKEIQKLGELYKNRKEAAKAEKYSPDLAGGEQAGKTGTPEPRMSGPSVPEQMRGAPPVMGPRPGAPPSAPSEQVTPEEKLTRWLRKTLDVNKGALAESPAIQDALRQLRRARSSAEPLAADDKSWVGQFARFSQS